MRTHYLLITFLLFLLSGALRAQEWRTSLQRTDSLFAAGQRDSAVALAKAALTQAEQQSGIGEFAITGILRKLGSYYYGMADYRSAEPYHKRALTILERNLAPNDTALGSVCFDLAGDYLFQQQFDHAAPLFYQSLQIREQALGSEHPEVARSLNALAALFIYQQKFDDALPLSERALTIWKQSLGPDHPNVAKALTNIAIARNELGDLDIAETLYVRLLDLREQQLGADHPEVANVAIGLGKVRYQQGNYAAAKPLFQRAIAINRAAYGDDHYITALANIDLATLYVAQAKRADAEQIFRQAIAVLEKSLGPENIYVANVLKLLASLYLETSRYADASREYQRALTVTRAAIGDSTPDVGLLLSNLGDVAELTGDYVSAESLHTHSLAITEKEFGPNYINLLPALNGLALTLSKQGKFTQAEPIYQRALRIGESYGGKKHRVVAATLEFYAGHARARGRTRQAQELLTRALEIRQSEFHTLASVLPERDALTYASLLQSSFDRYLSGHAEFASQTTAANAVALAVFRTKGLVTDEFIARNRSQRSAQSDASGLDQMNQAKRALSRLYVRAQSDDTGFYRQQDSLSRMIDSLEEQIARADAPHAAKRLGTTVAVAEIQSEIPSNATLIEYVRYNHFTPLAEDGDGRYLAIVLRHAGSPLTVDLGPAVPIDSLILQYRKHIKGIAGRLWQPSPIDNAEYAEIGSAVVRAIWEPLSSMAPDTGMLLISPDGLLNLVSFAGLPIERGKYLVENHAIQYLSSGRDLLRFQDQPKSGEGLLAIGDPDFDATSEQRQNGREPLINPAESPSTTLLRSAASDCLDLGNLNVQRLPGTRAEIDLVAGLWRTTYSDNLLQFVGPGASEESFKQNAPGQRMIHIATHGYYTPPNCAEDSPMPSGAVSSSFFAINPLLTSGLFLAGANRNRERLDTTGEDGILTAEEVSAMDLTGTERVVLSACQSGLGEIESGEGIYGLRRAFQMAGAQTVISSLWPVPDNETSQLMSAIYSKSDGGSAAQLRQGMLTMLNRLRQRDQPDHPFLWASFVSIGDRRK